MLGRTGDQCVAIFSPDFSNSVHYHLSSIEQYFYHLFNSLRDEIASVNSLYEDRIIDVANLCRNTHLKHFAFGYMTGTAKVSREHYRCHPGLPLLVSSGP